LSRSFVWQPFRRARFLPNSEPKKANEEYDKIYLLKGEMRQFRDRGEAALKRISRTDDPDVQMLAAVGLLALDQHFAIGILERIRDSNQGLQSFTAEMALQQWNSGAIRDYWN